jgi:hypothetical protein
LLLIDRSMFVAVSTVTHTFASGLSLCLEALLSFAGGISRN